jgi:hypothetical protein
MNKAENVDNGYVDEAFQRSSDPKSTIKCVEILVRGTYSAIVPPLFFKRGETRREG